jgi:hypothetical protein
MRCGGPGFVTAEDRLFFMDVLRHTAEGTTAELLGPSAASADSTQLGLQDASPQQLTDQMASLPKTMGAEGAQALNDIEQYVAGINAFINLTQIDWLQDVNRDLGREREADREIEHGEPERRPDRGRQDLEAHQPVKPQGAGRTTALAQEQSRLLSTDRHHGHDLRRA